MTKNTVALMHLAGRLAGLAGTVRYDIPDALRAELKGLARLAEARAADSDASAEAGPMPGTWLEQEQEQEQEQQLDLYRRGGG